MGPEKSHTCVIGTAGHIDHGKTTLVAALTNTDTDRLAEEKRRGMSIDLGFAALMLTGNGTIVKAGLVDVPGHERFIKNMLAGATGMDAALFCVAADDGIMPQTREHFEIIRLLGVRECVFAVTKADCVAPERIAEVTREIAGLIASTSLGASPIAAVSAKTGNGLDELKKLLYEAALRGLRHESVCKGFFRLPIDRAFHAKGFGTVVTGTIASGSIKKGAELVCYPSGAVVKVRGIESLHAAVDEAQAGQRTALNITTPQDTVLGRGVILASPELKPFIDAAQDPPVHAECVFEFIREVDLKKGRKTFKAHHLTTESVVTLRLANGRNDCGRLTMRAPMLALRNDRLILRDTGRNETIGAAIVTAAWVNKKTMPRKPLAPSLTSSPLVGEGRGEGEKLPPLTKGGWGGFEELNILHSIVEKNSGVKLTEAALILNLRQDALADAVTQNPGLVVLSQYVISSKTALDAQERILEAIKAFHAANPTEPGMREDAALKASALKDAAVKKALLDNLVETKRLTPAKNGASLALPGFHPASDSADAKIESAVLALFTTDFTQCSREDLAKLPHNRADVDRAFAWLARSNTIVKLREGSYLTAKGAGIARERLTDYLKTNPGIKAAEFRDLLKCGRKLAIEILEYFDKERVTLRKGDVRTLR